MGHQGQSNFHSIQVIDDISEIKGFLRDVPP